VSIEILHCREFHLSAVPNHSCAQPSSVSVSENAVRMRSETRDDMAPMMNVTGSIARHRSPTYRPLLPSLQPNAVVCGCKTNGRQRLDVRATELTQRIMSCGSVKQAPFGNGKLSNSSSTEH